jgi:hypothetical protein
VSSKEVDSNKATEFSMDLSYIIRYNYSYVNQMTVYFALGITIPDSTWWKCGYDWKVQMASCIDKVRLRMVTVAYQQLKSIPLPSMDSKGGSTCFLNPACQLHSVLVCIQKTDFTCHCCIQVSPQCCQNLHGILCITWMSTVKFWDIGKGKREREILNMYIMYKLRFGE